MVRGMLITWLTLPSSNNVKYLNSCEKIVDRLKQYNIPKCKLDIENM